MLSLSTPHNVIKKERPHGARHGKTEPQKEYYVAHNAQKRCLKRNYEGIHDRFLRDPLYRDSQLKIGWTEEKCIEMDTLAQEDHSYRLSRAEYLRYQKHWYLTMTNRARMHRCDFDQTSAPQSQSWTASTENQEKNVQNLLLFNSIKGGTLLPQVLHGGIGTHPIAGGTHENNSVFLFVAVGFVYSWQQSCCKGQEV